MSPKLLIPYDVFNLLRSNNKCGSLCNQVVKFELCNENQRSRIVLSLFNDTGTTTTRNKSEGFECIKEKPPTIKKTQSS